MRGSGQRAARTVMVLLLTALVAVAAGVLLWPRGGGETRREMTARTRPAVLLGTPQGAFVAVLARVQVWQGNSFAGESADLMLYDAASGRLAERVAVPDGVSQVEPAVTPQLIGFDGVQLWLLAGRLWSHRLGAAGWEELRTPRVPEYADLAAQSRRLQWTATDGSRWVVDPATRTVSETVLTIPDDPESLFWQPARPAVGSFVVDSGRWDEETLLAVASEEEARRFAPGDVWAGARVVPDENVVRFLYRVRLQGEQIAGIERLADLPDRLQRGGLLREQDRLRAVQLTERSGLVVLYQGGPEADRALRVALVTGEGRRVWAVDTGLTAVEQIMTDGQRLAVIGYTPGGGTGDMLVLVRLTDGQVRLARLQ